MKRNEVIVSGRQKDKRVLERIKESNVRLYKKWINIRTWEIDKFGLFEKLISEILKVSLNLLSSQ
jgi:hypothetical protein